MTVEFDYYLGEMHGSNCYALSYENETILIDTNINPEKNPDLLNFMNKLVENSQKVHVIFTHSHYDHILGGAYLSQFDNVTFYASSLAAEHIRKADKITLGTGLWGEQPMIKVDKEVSEGDDFKLGDLTLKVLSTPGHSDGSICLYEQTKGWLFSGDTVFSDGSMGRVDLPSGDRERLIASLERLANLPNLVALYAGHGRVVEHGADEHVKESYQNALRWL
ncbi:MAG: MBL fold metallo-hydrolase [Candidatus Heimdallarchaeota archaeon]|nr:MBL fold metallo-hydrolase [Candidatus Heimdallarchaeota archaeon]MCK5048051.1 MBL fold metallo-hydrolase [Candidatus Heimdallarchaeota archaeon]